MVWQEGERSECIGSYDYLSRTRKSLPLPSTCTVVLYFSLSSLCGRKREYYDFHFVLPLVSLFSTMVVLALNLAFHFVYIYTLIIEYNSYFSSCTQRMYPISFLFLHSPQRGTVLLLQGNLGAFRFCLSLV